jgi:hypothetical protein
VLWRDVMTNIPLLGSQPESEKDHDSTTLPTEASRQPTVTRAGKEPGSFDRAETRRPIIPAGSWPRRMPAELAAAYCGETSVNAFLRRVGGEYPQPRVAERRRRLWLRDDLDAAILPIDLQCVRDVAEDL